MSTYSNNDVNLLTRGIINKHNIIDYVLTVALVSTGRRLLST